MTFFAGWVYIQKAVSIRVDLFFVGVSQSPETSPCNSPNDAKSVARVACPETKTSRSASSQHGYLLTHISHARLMCNMCGSEWRCHVQQPPTDRWAFQLPNLHEGFGVGGFLGCFFRVTMLLSWATLKIFRPECST